MKNSFSIAASEKPAPRVRLVSSGLELDNGTRVPLYAGSVHYWRLERHRWQACLQAVQSLGLRLVDLYIPWAVHERAEGSFDFGEHDTRLDVVAFLEMIHSLGLYAIVRPGPHVNAELTYFGIPKRVIWNRACQARSPRGNPVMLPMVPLAFPVPSYASEAFYREVARYFEALAPRLAPLRYPDGPLVLLQIDNEGALYFRDGAYDQDYHPDAIELYRTFLQTKYVSKDALQKAYNNPSVSFHIADPPTRFDATVSEDVARHLDWVEFHESLLAIALGRMRHSLEQAGLSGIPTMHNLPFGQETTPLNPARLVQSVDMISLDYYHKATPLERTVIARRTTELVTRSEGHQVPAFAAEMGVGFPPFFPPLEEADSVFAILCALAYGLRGFNLYMAVERDRWIGAPIDAYGHRRPLALFYEKLCTALERVEFHSLRRQTPVRLMTPRSLRRLWRVMHAFGPASGALFAVLGAGARERCFEDELGMEGSPILEADSFLRSFEEALEARGVPFAHVGGEDAHVALEGARWVLCPTAAGIKPDLIRYLISIAQSGVWVTMGPRIPERDGAMRPLQEPVDTTSALRVISNEDGPTSELQPAMADRAVASAIESLGLPTFACEPAGVYVTLHENEQGAARVLFVLNPTSIDVMARMAVAGVNAARDMLDGTRVEAKVGGLLEVRMPPRTVRMMEVVAL